ncbi:germination protein YpeB [Clostridium rectalis]|uniref:germination protein YpeB n=1 Tax=Clostridium rectalis TaxID=2040295 RepID=UPI000F636B99|nr:germination protein YpeB [Clostridium rectalis]
MKFTRKRMIYTAIVTLIVVFSATFAILMTLERTDYRNYLQAEYSKNMYGLMDSVQNIRVNLGKASIVGSKEQGIVVFEEIFRHSSMANDKLHSLPISQQTIENTSKFLSQVGDFCYTLGQAASEGKDLQEKDYQNIEDLKNRSFELEANLNNVSNDISQGKIKWGEIRKKASGVFAQSGENLVNEKFKTIQKQVSQYPALIYDGPFSDNVLEIKPKVLSEKKVSQGEAEKVVKKVVGENKINNITLNKSESNTKIPTYSFHVSIKGRNEKDNNIVCEVSKNGGKVVYLLDNKNIEKAKISMEKAIKYGSNYLKGIGYSDMVPMYSLNYNNIAVISYVYKQNNILVYPDQIKLKVALDDGSIMGIESEKYLVAHSKDRKIPSPKITADEAKKRVGKKLNINSIRLAVVPDETNKEVLCYEFSGRYNNDNFIVYINAETGYEQRILQIINTPNGQLTM